MDDFSVRKYIFYTKVANNELLDPIYWKFQKEINKSYKGFRFVPWIGLFSFLASLTLVLVFYFTIITSGNISSGYIIIFLFVTISFICHLIYYIQFKLGIKNTVNKMQSCQRHRKIQHEFIEYCEFCKMIFGYYSIDDEEEIKTS